MYTVVHLVVSFIKLFQFQCRLAFLIVSDVRIKIIVNLLSSIFVTVEMKRKLDQVTFLKDF